MALETPRTPGGGPADTPEGPDSSLVDSVRAYNRACLEQPGGYSATNHCYLRDDVVLQTYEILLLFRRAFLRSGWDAEALADKRILEVGCAWGLRLGQLPGFNARPENLCGIDLQPTYVGEARDRYPGMRFEVMSATEMKFADGAFDASFAVMALSAMLDTDVIDRSLAEMCRVSRDFVLIVDNFEPGYENSARGETFFRGVAPARVERLEARSDVAAVYRLGSFWTTSRIAWGLVSWMTRLRLGSIAYAFAVRLLSRHSHRGYLVELQRTDRGR